jgi:uncharacterized protein (TIGR02231 family)
MIAAAVIALLAAGPSRVVVYPDRAQVSRTSAVDCGARVPVVFERIPPSAAKDSLRAEISSGSIVGLRAELVTLAAEFNPKIEALRKRADELNDQAVGFRDEVTRAQTQFAVGDKLRGVATRLISREMTTEKPDLKSWQAAFDQSLHTQLAADQTMADAELKLADIATEQALVQAQLQQASAGAARQAWKVEVLAECAAGLKSTVTLTYLVGDVSWVPAYEARTTVGGVDLTLWATVQQTTGESWENVALVLSTAAPLQNATPPELNTLKLSAYQSPREKKVLVARSEVTQTATSGNLGLETKEAGLTTVDQGLSVQMAVTGRVQVSGEGQSARVRVGQTKLVGKLELRATPKLLPAAFRVVELTNSAPWPLLPGVVDAYRGSGFVGRYPLERVPQGGTFDLSFGLEESVRVKRTTLSELKREQGLFNDKIRFSYAYSMELTNHKKTNVEVALVDQVPTSEVNDVTIGIADSTTSGFERSTRDGSMKWKVKLSPQERKTVKLGFSVDVPNSYDSSGL